MMLSKKVFCWLGRMVLSREKARPTSPLDAESVTKESDTTSGRPMAWALTVAPPMSTVSRPTGPFAKDESP